MVAKYVLKVVVVFVVPEFFPYALSPSAFALPSVRLGVVTVTALVVYL